MKWFLLAIIFSLLFNSCEFQSFSDYEYLQYDGEFTWTQLTKNAEWPNRYGLAAVSFNDKIWIFGGYNPGAVKGDTYYEDVWSSTDGVSWDLVLEKAPWLGRRGHRVLVFNDGSGDAMFLVGGYTVNEVSGYREYTNDVWKSKDGKEWIQIKERSYPDLASETDWFPRFNHAMVVVNQDKVNYMYIIGGASMLENRSAKYAMRYFNDVWRSSNGINWEKLNNTDFGIRSEAAATVNPETGRIYLQGGVHGVIFEPTDSVDHPLDDWQWLWHSDNGETWVAENDTAAMEQSYLWRSDHQMIYYHDALWGFPGKTTSNEHYHFTEPNQYPIWKNENDSIWSTDSEGDAFDPRHGYASVILNDKVYILGGFTSSNGQSNDVWMGEIK
ncbi:MAG: hypothetical protein ACERKD_08810 [Prolixibacteraceae bacterium]